MVSILKTFISAAILKGKWFQCYIVNFRHWLPSKFRCKVESFISYRLYLIISYFFTNGKSGLIWTVSCILHPVPCIRHRKVALGTVWKWTVLAGFILCLVRTNTEKCVLNHTKQGASSLLELRNLHDMFDFQSVSIFTGIINFCSIEL